MAKFSDEEFSRICKEAKEHVELNRRMVVAGIEKNRKGPPPMDTAEKLHEQLTRAFAALHKIAMLPCQTDPEEAANMEEVRGYRTPCKDSECAPCLAFRALIVEGQLPA